MVRDAAQPFAFLNHSLYRAVAFTGQEYLYLTRVEGHR